MATTAANIRIGAATVYIDTYVSTGTTITTPTDVGHHKVPVEIGNTIETVKIEGERSTFPIATQATKGAAQVKVVLQEVTQSNMVTFLQGAVSGTTIVNVGDASLPYKQIKVVQVAGGVTQTWIFWKCAVSGKEPLKIAKNEEVALSMTFDAFYDDSVPGADKLFRWTTT
jgi:hypothetical protein